VLERSFATVRRGGLTVWGKFMRYRLYWLGIVLALNLLILPSALAEPLVDAAKKGDRSRVKQIIAEGADVNVKDRLGLTALHLAAYQGDKTMAQWLIRGRSQCAVPRRRHHAAAMGHH